MTVLVIIFHVIVSLGLMVVILMQSGRGGGLTESFAAAEGIFGAQTSAFMIKATSVLSMLFLVTCLSLAFMSSKRQRSLMSSKVAAPVEEVVPNAETTVPTPDAAPAAAVEEATTTTVEVPPPVDETNSGQ